MKHLQPSERLQLFDCRDQRKRVLGGLGPTRLPCGRIRRPRISTPPSSNNCLRCTRYCCARRRQRPAPSPASSGTPRPSPTLVLKVFESAAALFTDAAARHCRRHHHARADRGVRPRSPARALSRRGNRAGYRFARSPLITPLRWFRMLSMTCGAIPSAAMPLAADRRRSCQVNGAIGTPPFNSAMRASSSALRRLSRRAGDGRW